MNKKNAQQAMKNAEASVAMEGNAITQKMRHLCAEVLAGQTTVADALAELKREEPALREALASEQIEGREITAQQIVDCIRLHTGETTPEEIAGDILKRPSDPNEK
jgi:Fic family protein